MNLRMEKLEKRMEQNDQLKSKMILSDKKIKSLETEIIALKTKFKEENNREVKVKSKLKLEIEAERDNSKIYEFKELEQRFKSLTNSQNNELSKIKKEMKSNTAAISIFRTSVNLLLRKNKTITNGQEQLQTSIQKFQEEHKKAQRYTNREIEEIRLEFKSRNRQEIYISQVEQSKSSIDKFGAKKEVPMIIDDCHEEIRRLEEEFNDKIEEMNSERTKFRENINKNNVHITDLKQCIDMLYKHKEYNDEGDSQSVELNSNIEDLSSRLEKIDKYLSTLNKHSKQNSWKILQLYKADNHRDRQEKYNQRMKTVRCYKCNQKGHYQSDCNDRMIPQVNQEIRRLKEELRRQRDEIEFRNQDLQELYMKVEESFVQVTRGSQNSNQQISQQQQWISNIQNQVQQLQRSRTQTTVNQQTNPNLLNNISPFQNNQRYHPQVQMMTQMQNQANYDFFADNTAFPPLNQNNNNSQRPSNHVVNNQRNGHQNQRNPQMNQ